MRFRPAPTTTLSVGLLVAVAALPLHGVFGGWNWAISVIGAAIVGAVTASIIESTRRGIPLPFVAISSFAGATVWSLAVSLRDSFWTSPTGSRVWTELGDGITHGWGALLDEQLKLTDPQSAETFAAFFAWMCAAASVHLIARIRTALPGVAAAAVMLAVCTAAALKQGLPSTVFGAAAGAVALFAIATVTRAREQRFKPSRAFSLTAMIGVAAGVALLAGVVSTTVEREPFDPRTSRGTETVEIQVPDILAEFQTRRLGSEPIMTVDSASSLNGVRLRLQVYDRHDGERWLPSTNFQELASFPTPDELPQGEAITIDVDISDLDGPWIPIPDRLTALNVDDLRWDAESQTVITVTPPTTYRVSGTVIERSNLEGLQADRMGVDEQLSEAPPGLPDEIRTIAEQAVAGTPDTVSAIDAITARVREFARNESGAPGSSFGRLRDDIITGNATGAEQIASIHALMLRSVGIPSRVVVGYVPNGPVVKASDLHIWTETPFPGIGWVASDPVPAEIETGDDPAEETPGTTTTMREEATIQASALPTELGPGENPDEAGIGDNNKFTAKDGIALLLAGMLGVLLLMVLARILRRRIRHSRSARPDVRVLGAWAEIVDRLRELGAPINAMTTINDVVTLAEEVGPDIGDQVEASAALASVALHAPNESNPEDGDQAWEQLRAMELTMVAVAGRRAALRRFVDPRVLRYRAPLPPGDRSGGRRSKRFSVG